MTNPDLTPEQLAELAAVAANPYDPLIGDMGPPVDIRFRSAFTPATCRALLRMLAQAQARERVLWGALEHQALLREQRQDAGRGGG